MAALSSKLRFRPRPPGVGFDLKSVGSDRKNRGVSPNRVWGLTEISEGPNDHSTKQDNDFPIGAARLSYVLIYFSHSSARCVLFEKESRSDQGTNDGTYPFVPLATYSAPAIPCVCSIFPPAFVGRAARPRAPTSPAMLTLKASSIAKARRSWGLSADFALGGKIADLRAWGRGGCAPRLWAVVLGWRHGVGRLRRTPSHSRAERAALLAWGSRQMRGGTQE